MSQSGFYVPGGGGGSMVTTITGNAGGAVSPNGSGNINIVGSGTDVTTTGNPGTNTVTISLGGMVAEQLTADSGAAVPSGHNVNIKGGTNISTSAGGEDLTINFDPTPEINIIYVGKHGNDANSGRSIEQAKLTFGAAITAAFALAPAVVKCFDDGTYTEDLTGQVGVDIDAINATISGEHVLESGNRWTFGSALVANAAVGFTLDPTKNSTAYLNLRSIVAEGTGICFSGGILNINCDQITIESGFVVGNVLDSYMVINNQYTFIAAAASGCVVSMLLHGDVLWLGNSIVDTGNGTLALTTVGTTARIVFQLDSLNILNLSNIAIGTLLYVNINNVIGFPLETGAATSTAVTTDTIVAMTDGGGYGTTKNVGDTALLQAYNTLATSYTTFGTLTAGNPPTFDLASATTINSSYIYRAGGTDVAVIDGGTGVSTVPTDGQLLIGSTIGAGYVVANLTAGTGIGVANAAGSITVSAAATVPTAFVTDAGTANPALNSLTVAGGTNISTAGAGSTVTVNLDADLTGIASITMAAGGEFRTGIVSGNTALLRAYNVGGASYTTFATLTADATTPTMDLSDSVTKAGNYIYRAGGTDVPVTDGGTGLSATTAYAVLCGGTTATSALQSIASVGNAGEVLTSNGAGALPTFQVAGGGGFTWTEETGATIAMVVDNGYITNRGTLITATLPATAAVGTIMAIAGSGAGGWLIAQRASQMIHFGNVTTTTGVGGSLASTLRYDCVEIICIVADLEWVVRSSVGNLTVV